MRRWIGYVVVAGLLAAGLTQAKAQPTQAREYFTIGTGLIRGVYFPIGGAICQLVNLNIKSHGLKCLLESTDGSIYNLQALHQRDMDFAIAQSDWQYHAYHGSAIFQKAGAFKDLRTVFTLHSEPFTVVARAGSGIRSFNDLKGKRVNIGNPGSGTRITMDVMMNSKGWTYRDFKKVSELKASEELEKAFCDGDIDAFVHTIGHPNTLVEKVTGSCDAVMVPLDLLDIEKLLKQNPFYVRTGIPAGMYKGMVQDIPSFGVKAALLTTSRTDDRVVQEVLRAVFGSKTYQNKITGEDRVEDNFHNFRTLHPVFSSLSKEQMAHEGMVVPMHPAAIQWFQEAGILKTGETPELYQ